MPKNSNITAFLKNNAVALIAACAALVTACLVPPDAEYAGYFDWRTLSCLFCILGLVAAFRHAGFFEFCSQLALRGFKTTRQMVLALTLMTGVASMFITNDMALILFLPLSTIILLTSRNTHVIPFCFIMQTLAANLMGMIMPFGNPQNLFLFSFFEISLPDFLRIMALPFAASTVGIIACCVLITGTRTFSPRRHTVASKRRQASVPTIAATSATTSPTGNQGNGNVATAGNSEALRERIEAAKARISVRSTTSSSPDDNGNAETKAAAAAAKATPAAASASAASASAASASAASAATTAERKRKAAGPVRWAIYGGLFLVTLTGVFRLLPFWIPLAIVASALLALDRKALKEMDWGLLLTFVFFFVFSGNMARIPEVNLALSGLMETNALVCSALLSQVISNVPSAVLLAQFTSNYPALLIGVNIGGAGTVVGSLASLITLNHFRKAAASREKLSVGKYLAQFSLFNFAFLAGLLLICSLAGF